MHTGTYISGEDTVVAIKQQLKDVISTARRNAVISEREVKNIIAAAGKSVSNAEAKQIGALFESRIENLPPFPGASVPKPSSEHPHIGFGASQKLNAFFVERNLPFGGRVDEMRGQINAHLARVRLNQGSTVKPRIDHLPTIDLQPGLMDAPRMTAHVDVRKGEYFLSRGGGGLLPPGMEPPATRYWGPFALPKHVDVNDKLSAGRQAKIERKLDGIKADESQWTIHSGLLPGQRNIEMKLKSDDTYNYTALIPVGPTDFMPTQDPNDVLDLVVMRMPKVIPPNARIAPQYINVHLDPRDV